MARNGSNTAAKQGKKKMPAGKPFKANDPETGEKDPRINRNGRPKSFDQLRTLFQDIASEEVTISGKKYTRAQAIGIAMSMDKKLMREFLEFAYGKVPQAVDVTSAGESLAPKVSDEERMQRMKELAAAIAQEINKDA